ncbi:MAG: hypothetical protein CVU07_09990, partial [Bacteroidetes bacterium HGW-Bacteroidetes-23]
MTYTISEYEDTNNNGVRDAGENNLLNTATCTQEILVQDVSAPEFVVLGPLEKLFDLVNNQYMGAPSDLSKTVAFAQLASTNYNRATITSTYTNNGSEKIYNAVSPIVHNFLVEAGYVGPGPGQPTGTNGYYGEFNTTLSRWDYPSRAGLDPATPGAVIELFAPGSVPGGGGTNWYLTQAGDFVSAAAGVLTDNVYSPSTTILPSTIIPVFSIGNIEPGQSKNTKGTFRIEKRTSSSFNGLFWNDKVFGQRATALPLPVDITVNCGETIPNAVTLAAEDNCGTATVVFNEVRTDIDATTFTLTRTWTTTDGCSLTAEHTQIVTVLNCLPTAIDDNATTNVETPISIDVLNNDDFGGDGPNSSAIVVTEQPANGTATVNDNGTPNDPTDDIIVYIPNPGFDGSDSFVYQICDSNGDCDTATVTVTVFDPCAITASNPDTDGDGISDFCDDDDDNDGILDTTECSNTYNDFVTAFGSGQTIDILPSHFGLALNQKNQNVTQDLSHLYGYPANSGAVIVSITNASVHPTVDAWWTKDGEATSVWNITGNVSAFIAMAHDTQYYANDSKTIHIYDGAPVTPVTVPGLVNQAPVAGQWSISETPNQKTLNNLNTDSTTNEFGNWRYVNTNFGAKSFGFSTTVSFADPTYAVNMYLECDADMDGI